MQKTQTEIIDSISYTVTQFSATKGLKMFHRVGKYIGPAMGKLGNASKAGNENKPVDIMDLDISVFGEAIKAFFDACPEHEFEATIKELLTCATRDGKQINFDLDFAGELGHLFKVLAFVLKVQFGNFFKGVKGFGN